ncbi:beta propeller repeat protein [Aestuariivivens sediminicola]|uniref:oxidoreductase n=1 Tax=Aestuariivivens sediminicola TaxID=2913560 RepID=UPI001F55F609|nr:oxidoreductase [Aestuariivivens sediminicola]
MLRLLPFVFVLICFSCHLKSKNSIRDIKHVEVINIYEDSLLSVRAIELLNDKSLAFAGNRGVFGLYQPTTKVWQTGVQKLDSINLHFRSVAHTSTDFFMLTIDTPAVLFKTGNNGELDVVYLEEGEDVFYDAMTFWNDLEGIAVGDSVDDCLSIIITRDGGATWNKKPCSDLPPGLENEGAFAASNTNIAVKGDKTWVATTNGRIYYSGDKGETWEVFDTPMVKAKPTEGIYSIAFYDASHGFGIGGDYTNPEANSANKMKTSDGGRTWELVGENEDPGYRSCVQYVPGRAGTELVAVGFKGIDYSNDFGASWQHLSDESFYTIRFLNDSVAYAAGMGRISKLTLKK